jgi:alpha-mannosidase
VFVTHKMSWNDTNRMPNETFFWQGIDGTQAPAYFLTTQPADSTSIGTTYCPDLKATHVMGTWRRYAQKANNDQLFLVYGHGDGGGGPTREMLEHIRRMEKGIPGCPRVEQGFMGPFFERLVARMQAAPDDYPTWVGELYLEFHRGTFTSVAKVKRNNRLAEATMRELEALASLAFVRGGRAYPEEELAALWDIVLLNQFHDILPGSSIGDVYEDSDRDYAEFFARAETLRRELAGALAGAGGYIVSNCLGTARGGLVEVEADHPVTIAGAPTQSLMHADGSLTEAAPLPPVPPLGASRVEVEAGTAAVPDDGLVVSPTHLENRNLRASFDAAGRLTSLFDKRLSREVLLEGQPGNRLQAFRDYPEEYDAWDIDATFEDQVWEIDTLTSAEVVETGPYRAAIRFAWTYESSRIVQVVSLEADAALLTFDTFIDWHEHHTLVKTAFPLDIKTAESRAEIQFGHVARPTHANTSWDQARFETPMHRWVELGEPGFGVAVLNDCKYGYDAKGTTLRLTLLRSPTWPWPDADQGEHHFRYGLLLHHGLEEANVSAAAEAFNKPLALVAGSGAGKGCDLSSLVTLDNQSIVAETLKRSEDGDDLILRLWERHGRRQATRLRLADEIDGVAETDLLEENASDLALDEGGVSLAFGPFEIKTLRLRLKDA